MLGGALVSASPDSDSVLKLSCLCPAYAGLFFAVTEMDSAYGTIQADITREDMTRMRKMPTRLKRQP